MIEADLILKYKIRRSGVVYDVYDLLCLCYIKENHMDKVKNLIFVGGEGL